MAEGLFLHHVKKAGLRDKFRIDSAGTSGWHTGERPDPRMEEIAGRHGVTLISRSRQLLAADFETFDYILVMDRSNFTDAGQIEALADNPKAKLRMMMDYDPQAERQEVPDPYYGGKQGFEQIFQMLSRATNNLLQEIRGEYNL